MRAVIIGLALCASLGAAGVATADTPDRDVDFSGGLVINRAPSDAFESFPGVTMQLRYFAADWLYVAAMVSGDLGFDFRNPEQGEVVPMLGIGGGAGVYQEIGARLTGFAGGRAEWLNAWGWPVGDTANEDFHSGIRGGPTAGLALRIGSAFGHPMFLEANASYLYYRVPRSEYEIHMLPGEERPTHRGLQLGFFLTGVLFPEPRAYGYARADAIASR